MPIRDGWFMIKLMKTKGLSILLAAGLLACPLAVFGQDAFSASYADPYITFVTEGDLSGGPAEYAMWRNDELVLRASVRSETDAVLSLSVSSLHNDTAVLPDSAAVCFLDKVSASAGMGDAPAARTEVSDLVSGKQEKEVPAGEEQAVLIRLKVPADAGEGTYTAAVSVNGVPQLDLKVNVCGLVRPGDGPGFELWQYPYASLRYYDCLQGEPAFSEKHLAVLKQEMAYYRELGGRNITVTISDDPWGSQTYDSYPSMVKWLRAEDGSLRFDYSDLDAWVGFCLEAGVDERIDVFGILPFSNELKVITKDGPVSEPLPAAGSSEWEGIWRPFLTDFAAHLEEKGWLDMTYICVDERAEEDIRETAELVKSVSGRLKLGLAEAEIRDDDFYDDFDRLAVSIGAFRGQEDMMRRIIQRRKEKGLVTLLYTCSGTYPNSFALSQPAESVWTVEYLSGLGFDGFLRWAYDAWTEAPRRDLDWMYFEAGDTMLIYPDEKDAREPGVFPSYRLEMLRQGMRTAAKIDLLKKLLPAEDSALLGQIHASLVRGSGNWNEYGAMAAKNRNTDRLTYLEVRKMDDAVNAGVKILAGDAAGQQELKRLARRRPLLEKTGIDVSWDGIYLGYGKSLGLMNLAAGVYVLLLAAWHYLKHKEKWKAGLPVLAEILLLALYSGGETVLFDRRTPGHILLGLLMTILVIRDRKKKKPAAAGEEAYV